MRKVLRFSVYGIYLLMTAAVVAGWLPWVCSLTQLGSVPNGAVHLQKCVVTFVRTPGSSNMHASEQACLWVVICQGIVAESLLAVQAKALVEFAERTHMDPEVVFPLKRYAVKWHVALGATLTAGLVLGRMTVVV